MTPPTKAPERPVLHRVSDSRAVTIDHVDTTVLDSYEVHEAAGVLPMLTQAELIALAADIRQHGQQEPIWLYQGAVLDGRNRLCAALAAGVDPIFQDWVPTGENTPSTFVFSRNISRRHLSKSQKAALAVALEARIAAEAAELRKQRPKKRKATDALTFSSEEKKPEIALAKTPGTKVEFINPPTTEAEEPPPGSGRSREKAAELLDVSAGYVNDAKDLKKADPDMFGRVLAGELSIPAAQEEIVAQAQARGDLGSVKLRPGAVRQALDRLGERAVPRKEPAKRIRLPKASKVTSSAVHLTITASFGNPKIAEEWLNRLQDDPRCLNLDFEVLDKAPRKKRSPSR